MKLIRFGNFRKEKPGVELAPGVRKDCSGYFADWNGDFFTDNGLWRLAALLKSANGKQLPDVPADARIGAPIARPGKVICIGLNYSDHAAESGMEVPKEPIVFMKGNNTVVGPYDDILIPRGSKKTDWEVELGIVIGAETRYLDSPAAAAKRIAGYCISNDVSERAFQLERGGQWTKGKSCDTFNPLGPWLVTSDEVSDPNNLAMTLDVNRQRMQSGNTKTMVFNSAVLVHYLSQFMTLEAGDLISTGTPPGVGLGMKPPRYLKAGDVVELSIDGLGRQRQVCRDDERGITP
ncbi:MAG TPA: fumarylacetoacetate hydrolase family protein [Tepidisphaeraceae bacterium]|jgi:2-keto-4-pentenoate hydratase/2-oxohepta-3-ene-1,7-dioic acid hydratase in catechol pathway